MKKGSKVCGLVRGECLPRMLEVLSLILKSKHTRTDHDCHPQNKEQRYFLTKIAVKNITAWV